MLDLLQPALVDGDRHRHPVPDAVGVRPRHLPLSRAGLAPPRLLHARTRLLRPPHLRLRLRHRAPRNHREGHLLHVSLIKCLRCLNKYGQRLRGLGQQSRNP